MKKRIILPLCFAILTLSACSPAVSPFHESRMNTLATSAGRSASRSQDAAQQIQDNNQELESLLEKIKLAEQNSERNAKSCEGGSVITNIGDSKKQKKGSFSRVR